MWGRITAEAVDPDSECQIIPAIFIDQFIEHPL
jgi:hypothetical protein